MSKKIKAGLEGVVYVDGFTLKAGDEIPEGVEVGDHLLEEQKKPEPRTSDKK